MGEDEVAIMRRFLKIMTPGFRERLKLPSAFCEKLKQEKSEKAILESRIGMWEMKVCRNCGDDQIYFEDGWPRFVAENGLSVGDCLVFQHTQELHFNVVVYDPSACEKRFLVEPDENEHEVVTKEAAVNPGGKADVEPHHSQRPYFTVEMTAFLASKNARVNIPIEFVKSNNLVGKREVILRDGGRRWAVRVVQVGEKVSRYRVWMGSGWHDFYESNELKVGDVCLFQLDPSSPTSTTALFDVRIFPAN
ncbi:hypothetical protein C2S52_001559 [Perilla frutescens var. hirtella]|nr:hypothetical protein C2S51_006962 [Perilla frutescens var. frutescens]KAH6801095.1 hypothetical protein C2S52_001559 [Perilla frutescens var. hirtella]